MDHNAYQTAELAALYDAVNAGRGDAAFWRTMADATGHGPLLDIGCGTGRVLLPLARAGHEMTGIDLSAAMLARARAKAAAEPAEVRDRVRLLQADMTSFDLGRRPFAAIFSTFGGFHHLRTVEEQLSCLERCRAHLRPRGRLVLDLVNADPAPLPYLRDEEPADGEATAELVDWTDGRRIRSWIDAIGYQSSLQCQDSEITYEIIEADGSSRRLTETFQLRYVFRYELEHLLARAGFRVVALYGGYDCSPLGDDSSVLLAVAELADL
jgi:SAM-dependent methyltransferase